MANDDEVFRELLQALATASPDRKARALRILRGEETAPPPPRPEPYLTLRALSRELGVHECTLWRWKIPGHALGGKPRYRRSEVEAYFETAAFRARVAEVRAARNAAEAQAEARP